MMKKNYSFWNGKISGLPGFISIILVRLFESIIDRITSCIVKANLNNVGRNVTILRGIMYRYPNNISIGNNVLIEPNVTMTTQISSGKLKISDNVTIGKNSILDFSGDLYIKQGVLLSEGVIIETHDHGFEPRNEPTRKQLVIGENVWIGLNAIIMPNTGSIGDNTIIAAGAVVTKEVPANCIVAGIPAKIIKVK